MRSIFCVLVNAFLLGTALLATGRSARAEANAGPCCESCGASCQSCQMVECVVMVPVQVTETRLKTCVRKTVKEFDEVYTVWKRVPEKKEYKKKVCYLEDDIVSKVIKQKCCRRVDNPAVIAWDGEFPRCEVRYGPPPCPHCPPDECGCECACDCHSQPPVSIIDSPMIPDECVRELCVMKKEPCSRNDCRPDIVYETKSKVISYCVKVPKYKEEPCKTETIYKLVPVEKTRKITECVPEVVRKPVEVQVIKHVPHKITCCQSCAARKKHHQ